MCKNTAVRFGKYVVKLGLSKYEVQELQANQFAIELIRQKRGSLHFRTMMQMLVMYLALPPNLNLARRQLPDDMLNGIQIKCCSFYPQW